MESFHPLLHRHTLRSLLWPADTTPRLISAGMAVDRIITWSTEQADASPAPVTGDVNMRRAGASSLVAFTLTRKRSQQEEESKA